MTEMTPMDWTVGMPAGIVEPIAASVPPGSRSPHPAFWVIGLVDPARAERAERAIRVRGFETWRAVATVRRGHGKGRSRKTVRVPLLPSILFINVDPADVWGLQSLILDDGENALRGIARGLGWAVGGLARVGTADLMRFRGEVEDGKHDRLVPFEEGEIVPILRGALAGGEGTVMAVDAGTDRVRLAVSLFGGTVPVEMDFDDVGRGR